MSSHLQRPGPPGGARDRNRKEKAARLESAGRELFLARGLVAVTVDQIVNRAGMAKGSFYRYVSSKTELVDHLIAPLRDDVREAFARCRAGLEEADTARLAAVYLRLGADLTAAIGSQADAARLYLQECRAPGEGERAPIAELATEIRAASIELTELALERGLLKSGPAWVSATAVVGAAEELLLAHFRGAAGDQRPEEVQAALVRMVLSGIA
jgi:AcrR family transcriptional regulator